MSKSTDPGLAISYDAIFQNIVLGGIACGLGSPQEWIRNYVRSAMQLYPYAQVGEVEVQVEAVERAFVSAHYCIKPEEVTDEQLVHWFKLVYKD